MTTEEKVKEIIELSDTKYVYDIVDFHALEVALSKDLIEMAEWNDKQFAVEKSALIDRIADKFKFENFTFVDINGGVKFDYAKFYMFLEKISKEN